MDKNPTYILASHSALYYWLHSDYSAVNMLQIEANKVLDDAVCGATCPQLDEAFADQFPHYWMVRQRNRYSKSERAISVVFPKKLPAHSIAKVSRSLYITTPALTISRLAKSFSAAAFLEHAINLCASFYLDSYGQIGKRQEPLLTKNKLISFARANSSLYGCEKTLRLSKYIQDGSASPMETKLYLLLTLPLRWGGYGLVGAHFNVKVAPGRASARMDQQFFKIDIAYPQERVGIEFEGAAFHTDYSKDRRRVNALESLGWRMISVDKAQLYDEARFEKTAHQIATLLGRRLRRQKTWWFQHGELRKALNLV